MKKLSLLISLITLTACATTSPHHPRATALNNNCDPIERDLTTTWEARTYWCADRFYVKEAISLQKQIAYEKAQEEKRIQEEIRLEKRAQQKQQAQKNKPELNETSTKITKSSSMTPSVLATQSNNKATTVDFLTIDYAFEKHKVKKFAEQNKHTQYAVIQSCKLPSEPDSVVTGRNNAIKDALALYKYNKPIKINNDTCNKGMFTTITPIF